MFGVKTVLNFFFCIIKEGLEKWALFGEKNINMDIAASILFAKIEINQLLDSSSSADEEELLNVLQQIE